MSSAWSVGWDNYLASSLGYVLVKMDVSGSGYNGDRCRKSVHRRLGELETRDILRAIRSVDSEIMNNIFYKHMSLSFRPPLQSSMSSNLSECRVQNAENTIDPTYPTGDKNENENSLRHQYSLVSRDFLGSSG